MKDIGLNPLNYSFPVVQTVQNIKTNVDITMCRESLIYLGIAEIDTDEGLLISSIRKEHYLQYRKYSQSFYFINRTQYLHGNEIFAGLINLEEYFYVQKREYTKISEVFSVTGGYMQLISTIFLVIALFTKNLSVERKILNKLFNFNIKQKKIVLNILYEKKLNCFVRNEKGDLNAFIPFFAKKRIYHQKIINFHKINSSKNDFYHWTFNNTFSDFNDKNKIRLFNPIQKHNSDKGVSKKTNNIPNLNNTRPIFIEQNNINRSKMTMLVKDEGINSSEINKIFMKKKMVNNNNNLINENNEIDNINELKLKDNETMNEVSFKFSDYFCCCFGIKRNKDINVKVFNFGINFYRNQMNIINFFNIFF
jgi:hypothetical protein